MSSKFIYDRPTRISKLDIPIGKDRWISFVDTKYASIVELDDMLVESERIWGLLEVNCVTGCCGFDALSFLPKDVRHAAKTIGRKRALGQLKNLETSVLGIGDTELASDRLNTSIPQPVFLAILGHLVATIEKSLQDQPIRKLPY